MNRIRARNLAAGCINTKWGVRVRHPNLSSHGGRGTLSNTVLLVTTRVSLPNGISYRPTALAGCTLHSTSVTDNISKDGQTDRRTDHATVTSVAVGGIAFSNIILCVILCNRMWVCGVLAAVSAPVIRVVQTRRH